MRGLVAKAQALMHNAEPGEAPLAYVAEYPCAALRLASSIVADLLRL